MKTLVKTLGLIAATVSIMLLLFPNIHLQAAEKPINLVSNAWLPQKSPEGMVVDWFYKEVERAGNGKIKIEAQYSGALGGVAETLSLVSKGTIQLGFIAPGYVFSSLPLAATAELPYLVPAPDTAMRAVLELYESFQPFKQEFEQRNNIKLVAPIATDIAVAGFAGPVENLGDVKGKKIRAYGHYNDVVSDWGAVPVATGTGEIYEACKRGLVFGFSHQPIGTIERLKFYEVTPYLVEYGCPVHSVCFVIMNLDTWKKLPAEGKRAFESVTEITPKATADIYMKLDADVVKKFHQYNVHLSTFSKEEKERWKKVVVPDLWDKWIKRMEKPGLPVKEFIKNYTALVEKYNPMCTYVIPEGFRKD